MMTDVSRARILVFWSQVKVQVSTLFKERNGRVSQESHASVITKSCLCGK